MKKIDRGRGALLAAQFSFMPNRLGLCGPDANEVMLGHLVDRHADRELEEVLRGFHGAYPYLHFIAYASGIRDPFDPRVTEAYWIGNELLESVSMDDFHVHLRERFERRFPPKLLDALLGHVPAGAHAHHNFHVLAMPLRTGHQEVPHTLATMDACRVSWGRVQAVVGDDLLVERRPLVLRDGALALGDPQTQVVKWRFGGKAFCQPRPGDAVAIHWGCACQRLSERQLRHLVRETRRHLGIANARKANVVFR
ncbi:MAG: DUF6390 family protein [Armatimonadota bacterium]|nr:DUF6390 family protein [Armatimonadota bacterium]MDR5696871.1 DUF6390 family protein [Armatimonadota bacterium]